jgi:hypothetical protein
MGISQNNGNLKIIMGISKNNGNFTKNNENFRK